MNVRGDDKKAKKALYDVYAVYVNDRSTFAKSRYGLPLLIKKLSGICYSNNFQEFREDLKKFWK